MEKRYVISALVANRSGVLTRISGLFSRRGYNIESLCACATDDPEYSRMTVVLLGDEYMRDQMIKQMEKLEDVEKIVCANDLDCIYRELMLVKISATAEQRSQIVDIIEIYKARVVDLSVAAMTLEITGDPDKLDAFLKVIEVYGILEMQRTGTTALARGNDTLKSGN